MQRTTNASNTFEEQTYSLMIVPSGGGTAAELFSTTDYIMLGAAWSSDGDQVAVTYREK